MDNINAFQAQVGMGYHVPEFSQRGRCHLNAETPQIAFQKGLNKVRPPVTALDIVFR